MRTETMIKKILVEEGADGYAQTSKVLQRLENIPIEKVMSKEGGQSPESLDMDKETLRLLPFKGAFLKPCPGTKGYICCGYT